MPLGFGRSILSNTSAAVVIPTRTPQTITAFGNAQIDTAQKKYGTASALFDGTNDYLAINDTTSGPNIMPESDPFTVEAWVRFGNEDTRCSIANSYGPDNGSNPAGRWNLFRDESTNEIHFFFNGSSNLLLAGTTVTSQDVWYHVAVTRESDDTFNLWINGTSEASGTRTGNLVQTGYTAIGALSHNQDFDMNGHIDELRISDVARYTSGFTPPTGAFTNDENTLVLLHMDGTDGSTTFTDDGGPQ